MEKLYKIQENQTFGWEDLGDIECFKLTKENCSKKIQELIQRGYNPNRLRAVYDNES